MDTPLHSYCIAHKVTACTNLKVRVFLVKMTLTHVGLNAPRNVVEIGTLRGRHGISSSTRDLVVAADV